MRDKTMDDIYRALGLLFDTINQIAADVFRVAPHQPANCGCRPTEHRGATGTFFDFEISIGISYGSIKGCLETILDRALKLFGCVFHHEVAAHARRGGDGSACCGTNTVVASPECAKHVKVPLLDQLARFVALPRRKLGSGGVAIVQP